MSKITSQEVDLVDLRLAICAVPPLRRIGSGLSTHRVNLAAVCMSCEIVPIGSKRPMDAAIVVIVCALWRSDDWNRLHDSDYLHAAWLAAVRYPIRYHT